MRKEEGEGGSSGQRTADCSDDDDSAPTKAPNLRISCTTPRLPAMKEPDRIHSKITSWPSDFAHEAGSSIRRWHVRELGSRLAIAGTS